MNLVEKILALAERKGLTQAHLARVASVAPARVTDWKQGKGVPSVRQAWKLARELNVTLDYLADPEAREPIEPTGFSEMFVLETYRSLGIDHQEAIRRLHAPAPTGITQPKPLAGERKERGKDRAG